VGQAKRKIAQEREHTKKIVLLARRFPIAMIAAVTSPFWMMAFFFMLMYQSLLLRSLALLVLKRLDRADQVILEKEDGFAASVPVNTTEMLTLLKISSASGLMR